MMRFGVTQRFVKEQYALAGVKEICVTINVENIFGQHIGYKDIIFTPYSAEAHKPLFLRTARTYCKGAGAALNDREAAGISAKRLVMKLDGLFCTK